MIELILTIWLIVVLDYLDAMLDYWNEGWLISWRIYIWKCSYLFALLRICSFLRGDSAEIFPKWVIFLIFSRSFLFYDEGGDNLSIQFESILF